MATIANRDLLIKKEKQKLREIEIVHFKNEVQIDRKL